MPAYNTGAHGASRVTGGPPRRAVRHAPRFRSERRRLEPLRSVAQGLQILFALRLSDVRSHRHLLLSAALVAACLRLGDVSGLPAAAGTTAEDVAAREGELLTRVRRLTYDGRRAGEGYFSADGGKLVFQSEREPGNPFYQIYELDLASGETRRISPGMGKTTCSFLRPGTNEILYASTHHDPRSLDLQREELELRASGQERRYAWDYDPEMELWVADPSTLEPRRLTHERGYDAEASYSPDGAWIVFSSTRTGYGPLRDGETETSRAKQLETDPAYFGEIYVMPAAGGEARRLTDAPGYDGGPFFFADGSRIVWRRFDENGLVADVWTMKPDGTDQRRITDFGAMSWAPWADPTGRYVLFASNKLGFSNFEIYLVDAEGAKEPVRVTWSDGFDGLPVLSPDGRTLAWTSTRHGEPGGQIFVATWNHERALAAIEAAPPRARKGAS
jgi:Tol biopolymer transport system component